MKISYLKTSMGWVRAEESNGELAAIEFVSRRGGVSDDSNHRTRVIKQLREYFEGKRKRFSNFAKATLDGELGGTGFQRAVWREISKIPFGETITYKELAKRAGRAKAIRAAASACGKNPMPIVIPCHRVVGSSGSLGGYSGGLDKKKWLLRHEGARN